MIELSIFSHPRMGDPERLAVETVVPYLHLSTAEVSHPMEWMIHALLKTSSSTDILT